MLCASGGFWQSRSQIVVREGVVRCSNCAAHCKSLQSAVLRLHAKSIVSVNQSFSSQSSTSPSSHTNYRYLTTPERSLRVCTLQSRYKDKKKVISCLQEKVKQLTETQGLNIEPSLHDDLVTVMDQYENQVTKQHDENSVLETAMTTFEKWQKHSMAPTCNKVVFIPSPF